VAPPARTVGCAGSQAAGLWSLEAMAVQSQQSWGSLATELHAEGVLNICKY
jgi:hypothetical protein